MKKQYSITWDEYHECWAIVEAESEEEAQEKWGHNEYLDSYDDCQSIDNVEICEEEEEGEDVSREQK